MPHFYIELTDTYGGEANYCWVHRYKIKATTTRGAMTRLARHTGYRFRKDYGAGDITRYDAKGACVCAFVQWWDDDLCRLYDVETI